MASQIKLLFVLFQAQIMVDDRTSLNAHNKTQKFQVDVHMSVCLTHWHTTFYNTWRTYKY